MQVVKHPFNVLIVCHDGAASRRREHDGSQTTDHALLLQLRELQTHILHPAATEK